MSAENNETTVSINGGKPIPMHKFSSMADEISRAGRMADKIATLTREAVVEHIESAEEAAADAASDKDDDKPIVAKLTINVTWPAGAVNPEIEVKCSYSVRRVIAVTALLDDPQHKLPLEGGEK